MRDRRPKAAPTITDEQWSAARRVAHELDKVLDDGCLRREAIARVAAELRLTTRQIYNLFKRYRSARTVTALLPRSAETRRKRLPAEVEAIISTTLREGGVVEHLLGKLHALLGHAGRQRESRYFRRRIRSRNAASTGRICCLEG
ncbi:hypothetical protein [Rhizobium leguminosarum]|uniref:hypothetical protein n=1 Tax=Rhizobium leguminosarum TaxID=384 RepID=UPI001C978E7F|nr:hypothetical protein [Rhizobium leguminosarum]